MKKNRLLKQGLAVLLSLSMSLGPCAPGSFAAFADTAGVSSEVEISSEVETDAEESDGEEVRIDQESEAKEETFSDTEEAAENNTVKNMDGSVTKEESETGTEAATAAASPSDALYDEEGLLLDGIVLDDAQELEMEEEILEDGAIDVATSSDALLKGKTLLNSGQVSFTWEVPDTNFVLELRGDPETMRASIYRISDGTGDLVIPEEIEGYTIVSIGALSCNCCHHLTGIELPDTITRIGAEYSASKTSLVRRNGNQRTG